MGERIKSFLTTNLHALIGLLISVALISLNIVRIVRVPMTIDEPCYDATESYHDLMINSLGHANNHILHSIFRKFAVEHFGYNTFSMRLDSLLALCVYLSFSWLLCGSFFRNKWWQLAGFTFLNISSPFLFEFWGLSRGYGLALMFMIVSIYHFVRYQENKLIINLVISFTMAGLATYSNYSYINYYVALATVLTILNISSFNKIHKTLFIKESLVFIVITAAFTYLIYEPLKNTLHNGEQIFLGNNGFIEDTVTSVVCRGLKFQPVTGEIVWTVVAITCLCALFWIIRYFRDVLSHKYNTQTIHGLLLTLLIFIPVVSLIAQRHLLKINYLTDRAALFFIPLFVLLLVQTLNVVRPPFNKVSIPVFFGLLLMAGYIFITRITLNSTCLWWFDKYDLLILDRVTSEAHKKDSKVKLCVTWMYMSAMTYDIRQYYKNDISALNEFHSTNGKDTSYDFYYINNEENFDSLLKYYHRDTFFFDAPAILYKKN